MIDLTEAGLRVELYSRLPAATVDFKWTEHRDSEDDDSLGQRIKMVDELSKL